jgi:hypothetical protein
MEFKVGKNKVGSEMALLFFHISNDNLQYLMLTDIEEVYLIIIPFGSF